MNLFKNIPKNVVSKYLKFATRNNNIAKSEMIMKLIIFDFVYEFIIENKHENILEIGCGQGIHGSLFSHLGSVDITDLPQTENWMGDVDNIRQKIQNELSINRIKFTPNDGLSLPYQDNKFDIIFHNSVIEHVPDIVAFNSEVSRILKPDGIVICITGTQLLCIFRYFRFYLLRQPFQFFVNLRKHKNFNYKIDKLVNKEFINNNFNLSLRQCLKILPRLVHYVSNPNYNNILIHKIASEYKTNPDSLLFEMAKIIQSNFFVRIYLYFLPVTHGQHYYNILHEFNEWQIKNWINSFKLAGFNIKLIRPYRFQHLFEWTPSKILNAYIFLFFSPFIRIINKFINPCWSTEFILVAEKPKT